MLEMAGFPPPKGSAAIRHWCGVGVDTDGQRIFAGLHILLVEDEPIIAMALAEDVEAAGAHVIGPADRVERALDLIDIRQPDAAILDIGLGTGTCFPVADVLLARKTPFVFTSGYDANLIPPAYRKVPVVMKPAAPVDVIARLADEYHTRKRRG